MNTLDIVVGIQWGDEGKGRIVDLFAADYDVVARFGGGDNAGHSIKVGDESIALRIVPSGVLQPHAELFAAIPWGTSAALDGLLSAARAHQYRYGIGQAFIEKNVDSSVVAEFIEEMRKQ